MSGASDVDLPGGLELHHLAWILGAIFVVPACAVGVAAIYGHLANYNNPVIQRSCVRILLMIPIYCVDSYLSLLVKDLSFYSDVARDCYEAYVLYLFVRLLTDLAGGDEALIVQLERVPQIRYSMPFCCFYINPGRTFFHRCRQMILQYTIVKPILAVATFATQMAGVYEQGSWSPARGYMWITIVYNISVFIALYFLVLFYEGSKTVLAPHKPLRKFMCIKAIIFFAFWQSVLVSGMVKAHWVLHETAQWTIEQVETGVEDFILCVELLPIAVAFYFAFGSKSYEDPARSRLSVQERLPDLFKNFYHVANIEDVIEEAAVVLKTEAERRVYVGDFFQLSLSDQLKRVRYEGWLEKRGEDLVKTWKTRYFLLINDPPGLLYFVNNPLAERRFGPIRADECRGWVAFADFAQRPIEVRDASGFAVITPGRKWHFKCRSGDDRARLLKEIKRLFPDLIELDVDVDSVVPLDLAADFVHVEFESTAGSPELVLRRSSRHSLRSSSESLLAPAPREPSPAPESDRDVELKRV